MARYRGPSDASVAISGILSGLATIERGYRSDARDKDKFREALILQDRKTQYLGEQARADRDLRKFEFQWKTLTDRKKTALDTLESLNDERASLGVTDAQWRTIKYFEQTDDFQDITSAYTASNDEGVDNALFSYTDTDKQIQNLMSDVEMINTNIRISKELDIKMTAMSSELGAGLPEFYEKYRKFEPPTGANLSDEEIMIASFNISDVERGKIYDELIKQKPEMFGDIYENEVLQDLIRREISTQYSPAIARATELQTMKIQLDASKATSEASRLGDFQALAQSLEVEAQLALLEMGTVFQHLIFPPGEDGIADANKDIKTLFNDLKDIEGFPEGQAKAISEAIVSTPHDQFTNTIGPMMASVFNTLAKSTDDVELNTARQIKAALEKSNVYGYMDEESQEKFLFNLDLFFNRRGMLQKTMKQQGKYLIDKLGINNKNEETTIINPDAALNYIGLNNQEGETADIFDYVTTDEMESAWDSLNTEQKRIYGDDYDSFVAARKTGYNNLIGYGKISPDSLNAIVNSEVPLLNEIINNNFSTNGSSDFLDVPISDNEFQDYNPDFLGRGFDAGVSEEEIEKHNLKN